ncbi:MAG: right-handed parallel beta-helix repeat-containing protein [Candidatus Sumerlaeota bacterium]|nr:right-handed parallel beta-helix repeat-containing protein [Candidatus Sumerlaeota bacterium]
MPAASQSAARAAFYVSPDGNDGWSGTRDQPNRDRTDGPFATIARARDAVRELKAKATGPITVCLRGGTYDLKEPLVFAPQDSGSPQAPVIYAAYPGETPILSGGRAITGWTEGQGGVWSAQVPGVKEGQWYFRQLFVNGRRRQRARTPNEGCFQVDGLLSTDNQARFRFRAGDIRPEWVAPGDVEVINLNRWQHAPVIAPGLEQLIVYQGDAGAGQYVHHLTLRGLTFSYADWSMPEVGFADNQAESDGTAAVMAYAARACAIERCRFTHLGRWAVSFGKGSKENRIVGNEMTDLGSGGVKIGDAKSEVHPIIKPGGPHVFPVDPAQYRTQENYPRNEAETTSGNVVADNRIHAIGIVYAGAVGVWVGQSNGNTVAHNEIHDTGYSGISCGWTWGFGPTAARDNIIEFNHIYNIGRGILSDMGGIYTLGIQPGTVLRNNLIHDVHREDGPAGYGGWGVYLDATTTHVRVENNVIYRTHDGGVHQNRGQQNTIVNNILALGENAQFRRSQPAPEPSFTFERNIIYWKTGDLFWNRTNDFRLLFDYNLYWNAAGEPVEFGAAQFGRIPWEKWRSMGQDAHSLIADPLFADPEKGDFSLKPDSPAFKIGFKPIDVSQVGPRREK